ncbi:toprim domain-containing protein [Pseudoxanthomonas winnipegensis]|uniref:DNA primase n=1 Tax=Pseudoxanthomonas winnipegensis TaxID=2480810 RepID=A0A4V2HD28_9GAMM|nr:toprim domain-containing protein [Pseudoxanthomonas winnipegensis]RZZ81421.1 hypothetical protein EA663_20580 [Pseudoxanthomonas winnipegensis]TAA25416.1 hypothetical protein EA660_08120 [Pseudoxanthomonas winnipegensis]
MARGKWKSILPLLGIPANVLDGKHHRCPANGEGDDRFRFADRNGSGNFFCSCTAGKSGGIGLLMCCRGLTYAEAAKEVERVAGNAPATPPADVEEAKAKAQARIKRIAQASSTPSPKDDVGEYLAGRGLALPPQGLAVAPLDYYENGRSQGNYPTMVASIRGVDGKVQTLHLTYLQGGKKAPVRCPRKIVSGYEPGSAIRLFPAAEHLGVAEGIETALAANQLFDLPTWALANEGNLRRFRPPPETKRVSIFADRDPSFAGQAAAYSLAQDLTRAGVECDVFVPPLLGKSDWNDVLLERRAAA